MMRQRIISVLLLLSLVLPIGLTYTYLHKKKRAVRREIKWKIIEGIDHSELEVIALSLEEAEAELKWKHDHEFEYKTQMYDVVERKTSNDSITFWCWWDHEETQLSKKLSSLLNDALGTDTQRKDKESKLLHYLKDLFFKHLADLKGILFANEVITETKYKALYDQPFLELHSRPPILIYT